MHGLKGNVTGIIQGGGRRAVGVDSGRNIAAAIPRARLAVNAFRRGNVLILLRRRRNGTEHFDRVYATDEGEVHPLGRLLDLPLEAIRAAPAALLAGGGLLGRGLSLAAFAADPILRHAIGKFRALERCDRTHVHAARGAVGVESHAVGGRLPPRLARSLLRLRKKLLHQRRLGRRGLGRRSSLTKTGPAVLFNLVGSIPQICGITFAIRVHALVSAFGYGFQPGSGLRHPLVRRLVVDATALLPLAGSAAHLRRITGGGG
mmetsp:Transcript_40853/g.123088  ORF Transcript_40853/g.123088 Transcript_40853/m.123088 type:complete len:261 (+) Transcript_40853:1785-2567(+)